MFSADPKTAPVSLLQLPRDKPPRVAPAEIPEPVTSVIGNDLTLLGENITVISQKKLSVSGDIRGSVHGKQVLITETGSVRGTVSAENVEVRGDVHGSIRAVSVALSSTARVEGDIMQSKLAISEGARFDGRVIRASDCADLMPVLDPEAFATAGE